MFYAVRCNMHVLGEIKDALESDPTFTIDGGSFADFSRMNETGKLDDVTWEYSVQCKKLPRRFGRYVVQAS